MADLTRRTFVCTGVAAAVAPALQAIPAVAAPDASPLLAWVVGTPGKFDWQFIPASSEHLAVVEWVTSWTGGTCDTTGLDRPESECGCEFCEQYRSLEVSRVPQFDGRSAICPSEWLTAGLGHICSRCGYETFPEHGARAVADECVCEECMTLADWDIVDPERAAEIRDEAALDAMPEAPTRRAEPDGGTRG